MKIKYGIIALALLIGSSCNFFSKNEKTPQEIMIISMKKIWNRATIQAFRKIWVPFRRLSVRIL